MIKQTHVNPTKDEILLRLIKKVEGNETAKMSTLIEHDAIDLTMANNFTEGKKIVEWFKVDQGLADELADNGEVILNNLWGRTTSGSFMEDKAFNKIAQSIAGG